MLDEESVLAGLNPVNVEINLRSWVNLTGDRGQPVRIGNQWVWIL